MDLINLILQNSDLILESFLAPLFVALVTSLIMCHIALQRLSSEEDRWFKQYKLQTKDSLLSDFLSQLELTKYNAVEQHNFLIDEDKFDHIEAFSQVIDLNKEDNAITELIAKAMRIKAYLSDTEKENLNALVKRFEHYRSYILLIRICTLCTTENKDRKLEFDKMRNEFKFLKDFEAKDYIELLEADYKTVNDSITKYLDIK